MSALSEVDRCERLLADHLAAAVQRFGAAALGVVDLPPLDQPGEASPAQLRAAATLLWARHVDDAGLLDFTDALARRAFDGSLHLPVDDQVGAALAGYWREREYRFSAEERHALYGSVLTPVAPLLAGFCRALVTLGGAANEGEERRARIRVAAAAQELASELSERAVGMTGFAAREIVAHVRAAFDLLHEPGLAPVLGGLGPWQAIRHLAPGILGRPLEPARALDLARAGLTLLEWLADAAGSLGAGGSPEVPDAVIAAAATYAGGAQA